MPQRLPSPVFAGTAVLFFALVNLMKLPPYLELGPVHREPIYLTSLTLLPLAVVSTLAGVWIVRRVPAEKFYRARARRHLRPRRQADLRRRPRALGLAAQALSRN